MAERVQKYLARAGFGSRREIERWLSAGIIKNDRGVLHPGDRVHVDDILEINGKKVVVKPNGSLTRMLAYHKAEGEICTHNDPGKRSLAVNSLPKISHGRWLSVGRLDINTTGLLLFSNDGDLVHSLMHPSSEIEREYVCRVFGKIGDDTLTRLRKGVRCGKDVFRFVKVHRIEGGKGANQWFRIVLTGGKNREIRKAWQACGCEVNRLKRIRYGNYRLPKHLDIRQWTELEPGQIDHLRKLCKAKTV